MGIQTSIDDQGAALAGQPADTRVYDGGSKVSGTNASATKLYPGTVAFYRDRGDETMEPPPDFEADADDADGLIATPVSTAATAVSASGTDLDGAVGAGEHKYGGRVTVTLDADTDWAESNLEVVGKEAETGRLIREKLAIPSGGDIVLTTSARFSRVDSIEVEAQGGTGGGFTAGWLAQDRVNVDYVAGIVLRRAVKEPDADGVVSYDQEEQLTAVRRGVLHCEIEEDVSELTRPYMRVTAGSSETKGALRASSDSGDAVPLPPQFRFVDDGDFSADPLAPCEVNL